MIVVGLLFPSVHLDGNLQGNVPVKQESGGSPC